MKADKPKNPIKRKRPVIPERWYEVFGMGSNLPADFSEDNKNVLRIPKHYFMKF